LGASLTLGTFNNWNGIFSPTAASAVTLTLTSAQTVGSSAFLTPVGTNVAFGGTINVGNAAGATLKLGAAISVGGSGTLAFTASNGGNVFDLNSFSVTGATNTIAVGGATQLSIAATGGGTFTGVAGGTLSLLGCSISTSMITNNFGLYSKF